MSILPERNDPPYFAILNRTAPKGIDVGQYLDAGEMMIGLAAAEPGFLGIEETTRDGTKYTICYWDRASAVRMWRRSIAERVPARIDPASIVCHEGCLWPWLADAFDAVTRAERSNVVEYDFTIRAA